MTVAVGFEQNGTLVFTTNKSQGPVMAQGSAVRETLPLQERVGQHCLTTCSGDRTTCDKAYIGDATIHRKYMRFQQRL